jgi:hypothetical protein
LRIVGFHHDCWTVGHPREEGKGAPLAVWRSVSPSKIFAHAGMADTVEIFFRQHTGYSSTSLCLHGYFSLPVQCALTGTFILLCLHITRSMTWLSRRIQHNMLGLAAMKKSLPAAVGCVARQPADVVRCGVLSASAEPGHRLALKKLQTSFDAVMVKLDRIEALVVVLPCKTAR